MERHALAAEVEQMVIERSDDFSDPALWGAARAALQPVFNAPSAWIDRVPPTSAR